jgi:protease-4
MNESVVMGDGDGPRLALLEVEGVISEDSPRNAFGAERPSMLANAREALRLTAEDEDNRGLLLRIHSPGGTVTASETLHHLIETYRRETGRPVVAYLQGIAASGGYYTAVASDEIVAHPVAITGSIGVIMAGVNVSGLLDRFGVSDQTFTSGPYKDSGSPLREMREDEREYLQGIVDELQQSFIDRVVAGRPGLDAASVEKLADGRIYTAKTALEVGLIDSIGHLEDAIATLEKRAEVSGSTVIMYRRGGEYRDNVYSRSEAPIHVDIDVLDLDSRTLPAGFYYLWKAAVGD